ASCTCWCTRSSAWSERASGRRLAPGAGLLATAILLVHRRPGDALGVFLRAALLALAFLDVLGLALLLFGIGRLVSAAHGGPPSLLRGFIRAGRPSPAGPRR